MHFLANKHSVIISLLSDLLLRLADLFRPLLLLFTSVKEVKTNIRMMKYPFVKANCNTFNTSGCCDVAAFVEENKIALAGRNLLIQWSDGVLTSYIVSWCEVNEKTKNKTSFLSNCSNIYHFLAWFILLVFPSSHLSCSWTTNMQI